jgi:photosystem II stability/assembly factor-like uncharacterized protein
MVAGHAASTAGKTKQAPDLERGGGMGLATAAMRQEAEQAGAPQSPPPLVPLAKKEAGNEVTKLAMTSSLRRESRLDSGKEGWRVGPRGLIQKADTHGNWDTVPSGVDTDLFDISSPVPNVSWAVGQGGLIIRTTDGGKTWSRISAPTREDIVKISAATELGAQIETRGHQAWETTDGGKSWSISHLE